MAHGNPGPRGHEKPYPTEGKYTQDGGSRGLGPVHTPKVEYFPPGTFSGRAAAELPGAIQGHPHQGIEGDMAIAEVVHDLGFTPPVAPRSPELVGDKSQVVPFLFQDHPVRAMAGEDGEPWFVAADVCAVLEIGNPTEAIRRLDADEKSTIRITEGGPERNIISESGLFQLVFTSRKPEAKEFTRWVKRTVLPAIRKHGAYMTPATIKEAMRNPGFIIELATQLQEEQEKSAALAAEKAKIEAEKLSLARDNTALAIARERLSKENAVMQPKVVMLDAFMESDGAVEMDEAAKTLQEDFPGMGRNNLFKLLRRKGIMMYNKQRYNIPTQVYMNKDYFRVVQKIKNYNGTDQVYPQTYVKPAGMVFLYNLLKYHYPRIAA